MRRIEKILQLVLGRDECCCESWQASDGESRQGVAVDPDPLQGGRRVGASASAKSEQTRDGLCAAARRGCTERDQRRESN